MALFASPTAPTKRWIVRRLTNAPPELAGIGITVTPYEAETPPGVDATLDVEWEGQRATFSAAVLPAPTPERVRTAVARLRGASGLSDLPPPALVAPYLGEERLADLMKQGVSGLDLCGNAALLVPGRLFVFRSGRPNQYPQSTRTKNVYQGTSSLAARALLLEHHFPSLERLHEAVRQRGGNVTLSTLSKACHVLEEDLLIERRRVARKTEIRLLQPAELLDRLQAAFEAPAVTASLQAKLKADATSWQAALLARGERDAPVLTGASSALHYVSFAREPVDRYYCHDLQQVREYVGDMLEETLRFPEVEFLEVADPVVYYDRRGCVASPLQSYFELACGDKRQQDTARELRAQLLKPHARE